MTMVMLWNKRFFLARLAVSYLEAEGIRGWVSVGFNCLSSSGSMALQDMSGSSFVSGLLSG